MSQHRIVTGSVAALEAALAGEARAARARDPLAPITVLIGERVLRPYLRGRLAHLAGGHVNLRLLTANELAWKLGEARLASDGRATLPPLGERVLIEEIAASAGGYFAPVAHTPGFAEGLSRLFAELRQAGVDAAAFAAAAGSVDPEEAEPDKLAGLAELYGRYQARRGAFFGADDVYRAADPERFDSPCLLLYGVWQLPATRRELLERLMARGPLTAFFPATGTDADAAHAELRGWLERRGALTQQAPEPNGAPHMLAHLQRALFRRDGAAEIDGSVRLVSAPDPVREVREAARACLRWAEEGVAFHEMAVSFRHGDQYLGLIDEVFGEAGVPLYLHDGRPVSRRPVGRRIAALLGLIGSPPRRAAVMEFLTETVWPAATRERYGGFEPAAWDALSREAGIVEGRDQWLDRLRLLKQLKARERYGEDQELDADLQTELAEIDRLIAFIQDFDERLSGFPRRASWERHLTALRGLLDEYVEGGGPVIDALAHLTQLDALVERVPFERFRRTARLALDALDSSGPLGEDRGAFGRHGVNVLDINSLRHLRFRAVAVLGLAERAFPPPPRQDALLLDRERRALNRAAGWSIPPRVSEDDPEPLQFATAVQAARERLQLSFARAEAGSGRPRLPSHFFRAAAEALTGEPVGIERIDRLNPKLFLRVPASRFGAASPGEALTLAEYDRSLLALDARLGAACLGALDRSFTRARTAWSARWEREELTPWDGVMSPAARAAVGAGARLDQVMSATRLEMYALCPYKFFLHHLLKLRPVEEPELIERIDGLERGSLIHRILERFLKERGPDDPPRAGRRGDHLARLRQIADEECAEREGRGVVGLALLWRLERASMLEDLETWYDLEAQDYAVSGFRPTAFEVRFGPPWGERRAGPLSLDQPLQLRVEGQVPRFQGWIDRVDCREDGFRVIDYKTGGNHGHKDGCFAGGKSLQLPIYLLAAARALGDPDGWDESEAQYFFVGSRGGFKRVRLTGRTLRARWDEFAGLLGNLTGSIASGDFHPEPDGGENCRWCDYRDLCDVQVARLARRKAGSRGAAFIAMTEVE